MGALVCIYIVFPVLKGCAEYKKIFLVYVTVAIGFFSVGEKSLEILVSMLLGRVVVFSRPFDMFNPFEGVYSWAYVYFCLGGILCLYKDKIWLCLKNNRKRWTIYCVGLLMTSYSILGGYGIFVSTLISGNWDHVWNGYDTVFILIAVLALYGLSLNYKIEKKNRSINVISLIGRNTLGIYFIHMMFIHVLEGYIEKCHIFNNIFMQLIYSMSILIASLAVVLVIKKIPIMNRMVK